MTTLSPLRFISRSLISTVMMHCALFGIASVSIAVAQDPVIPLYAITIVNTGDQTGYFSDPYHVDYQPNQGIFISGTTPAYLECGTELTTQCAGSNEPSNTYTTGTALANQANGSAVICSYAGIHPRKADDGTWDAVVTLHVQQSGTTCNGISGWSVIVHAHPTVTGSVVPPNAWIGDALLIGSFASSAEANYDGKYFETPDKQLYLVYQKQLTPPPNKRDGVVARLMSDPTNFAAGNTDHTLLAPDSSYNSEDYVAGDDSFKLVETGNIRAYQGKFIMAYSVGAFDHNSYKLGIAYSDTFIPANGGQYRKVTKANPSNLWNTNGREIYYLLQAEENVSGWHYVGNQVLAPGVPTVADIGAGGAWILTFAGYDPNDAPLNPGTSQYMANHRRPFFININLNIPSSSVASAQDDALLNWITPVNQ